MRFSLLFFFLVTTFVGVGYWYLETEYVCPIPLTYRLGAVDEKFAISREELGLVLTDAETIWEEAFPEELFVYDESADFVIDFVYDERQQLARTEEEWRNNLDRTEKENESLLSAVERASIEYEAKVAAYEGKRREYESRLATYNETVARYNNEGGAPPEVFGTLRDEERALTALLHTLEEDEQVINEMAQKINEQGEEVNRRIVAYNEEVNAYNERFGTAEAFTQGEYKRAGITIYKFTDKAELTGVIAHEFGHALGLPHVEGEASIMYYLTTERADLALSATDREALLVACADSGSFTHQVRRVIRTVINKF